MNRKENDNRNKKFDVIFSNKKNEYETPIDFFSKLNKVFKFGFDLAASNQNTKCDRWITKEENSLLFNWNNINYNGWYWLNPPYGRKILAWIEKAYESTKKKICMLIYSNTETKYFHDYCIKSNLILFIRGRLKFNGIKTSAPNGSMLVFFGALTYNELHELNKLKLGYIIRPKKIDH